jgi:hypothetical protein
MPIFYAEKDFVIDVDGGAALNFLEKLEKACRYNITSLTVTGSCLMGDDGPTRCA